MKRTIKGTVMYPVEVEIEVEESASDDDVYEALLDEADKVMESGGIKPLLTKCEALPELED